MRTPSRVPSAPPPQRPFPLSALAWVALLATALASCQEEAPALTVPAHTYRLEALLSPDATTIDLSTLGTSVLVRTPDGDRDLDVAMVAGPVVVREGATLTLMASTGACTDRALCADYLLWRDGAPFARGQLTRPYERASFHIANDGTITPFGVSEKSRRLGPPKLTPVDPAHPEQGRLVLPDDVAQDLARGPAPTPAP